jgi:hypothetical protein
LEFLARSRIYRRGRSAMNQRRRLPNRRRSETIVFETGGHPLRLTAGYYPNGDVGEVFVNALRGSSGLDLFICDAAILASLALQYGATLDELRHALKHDSHGNAVSPIGAALEKLVVLT